jgi:hypothetical protein
MVEDQGRPARRRKSKKTVEQLKKEIADRDAAKAERAAARKANKKPLTPAEKYEQEKAARASRGSSGYGYSQHLMGGSGSSSGFNPRSVREEVLVDYLLDEGFASDEKSAEAIMGAMSEEWKQTIIEGMGLSVGASKLAGKLLSNPRTTPEQGARNFQRNLADPVGHTIKGAAKTVLGVGDKKNDAMMQKRRPN